MATNQYSAHIGIANVSTANSNLDGSGVTSKVITAASNGTIIKKIIIKATGTTSVGMIRLFLESGSSFWLWEEFDVSAKVQSSSQNAFEFIFFTQFLLESGYCIYASTENAQSFNIIIEGTDITNCPC